MDEKKEKEVAIEWDRSMLVVCAVGFALAFDYSITLISIQSYWHLVAPHKDSMYGFVFGSYDLGQFFFAPLYGWLSGRMGVKPIFVFAVVLNLLGNVLYSTAYVANNSLEPPVGRWRMVLMGRLLAGCGSAGIGLGLVYLSRVTTIAQRAKVAGYYRNSQTLARMIAPNIGLPLVGMGFTITTPFQRVFNFYTIPGWISVFVSFVVLLGVIFLFEDKSGSGAAAAGSKDDWLLAGAAEDTDSAAPYGALSSDDASGAAPARKRSFDVSAAPNLVFHATFLNSLHFCALFTAMSVYSQLFLLSTAHYHFVHSSFDLWQIYMGFAVAAFPTIRVWKRLLEQGVPDHVFFRFGLIFMSGAYIVLMFTSSKWVYFIGTGLLLAGLICYSSMMESFYTKKCTQYRDEAADLYNLFAILQPASSALARFLGPTVTGYVLSLPITPLDDTLGPIFTNTTRFPTPEDFFKKAYGSDANNFLSNIADTTAGSDKWCILQFPYYFFDDGCHAAHVSAYFVVLAVVTLVCCAIMHFWYLPRHKTHGDEETEQVAL